MAMLTTRDREMYEEFVTRFGFCWACGTFQGPLQNAHIVGGPGRRADRRALCRLCLRCHMLNHNARFVVGGRQLPLLTLQNLLWLKQCFDREHYDPDYLRSLRIKSAEMLIPGEPDQWFAEQWRSRPFVPGELAQWCAGGAL